MSLKQEKLEVGATGSGRVRIGPASFTVGSWLRKHTPSQTF